MTITSGLLNYGSEGASDQHKQRRHHDANAKLGIYLVSRSSAGMQPRTGSLVYIELGEVRQHGHSSLCQAIC